MKNENKAKEGTLLIVPIGGEGQDDWPDVELPDRQFLVKIQISLPVPDRVLIYDKNKEYYYEGPIPDELLRIADGRSKFYAAATVVDRDSFRKTLVLIGPACAHAWNGPAWRSPDGRTESVTCSRCGAIQIDYDLKNLP